MNANNAVENGPQTVSLADEDAVKQILVSTVFGLWDIVNNLTRLRPSKRERYRVTIFGSARTQPGTFVYDEVKRVAAALAEMGCDIITGGGPGLMQAANEGAAAVNAPERNRSVGIRVDLPFEQEVNPFVEHAFEHKTFFTLAPLRPDLGRFCGNTRRNRHRTRTHDDLAAAAGPARSRHAAGPRGQDVGRSAGLGQVTPADIPTPVSQSGRPDDPVLRKHCGRGNCPDPPAPGQVGDASSPGAE
jgi:hypothetical protein